MKKATKKTVTKKVKAKVASKTKSKSPAKAAKKAKASPKKKSAPALKAAAKKKPASKMKPVAKSKPPVKKAAAAKAKPLVKAKATTLVKVTPAAPPPTPAPVLSSSGQGTPENPWVLKTPAGFSEFQAYRDASATPSALVVKVGSTELRYDLRCLNDLHEMLKARGDWMLLGSADEQQPVVDDTVEAWARSPSNPLGGFYGLKAGLRGRFATYVPQVMEVLGMAEVEHFPNNNRMRAK